MKPVVPVLLDSTDRRLLRLLQANNRRRLRDLAEEVGVSAPTCLRRMRRLESEGLIRAHSALLDPARLGYGVTAFVEVTLASASGADETAFERRMERRSEVVQCSQLAGEVDYMLIVIARDMATFAEFKRRQLADDQRVRAYRSRLVLRQTKSVHALPV
jgi:Lrp/AsnC family transcriptional regulator, leucine-responsive regulatory protein